MDSKTLEDGRQILANHYANELTSQGKPTEPSEVFVLTECLVNKDYYARLQLETAVIRMYGGLDDDALLIKGHNLASEGFWITDAGNLPGGIGYFVTREPARAPRKK